MKADDLMDLQLEAWVLGALLDATGPVLRTTPAALIDAFSLTTEDFAHARSVQVFDAIRQLVNRRQPVEPQTVFALVQGDFDKLHQLQSQNAVDARLFEAHVAELHALKLKRRLRDEARHLLESLTRKVPVQQLIDMAHAIPRDLALPIQDEWGSEDAERIMARWEAACEGNAADPITPTGIEAVDEVMKGYVNGLNLIAGHESVGKSAYAASSIMAQLEAGHVTGCFGLEDATEWITKRHVAARLGIPAFQVGRRVAPDVLLRAHGALADISKLTRRLLVHREGGISPEDLVTKAKRWILKHGCRVIFIDHGGEIAHRGDDAARYDLAVKNTYQALRDLGVQYGVAVVVLCHFSDKYNADSGQPPQTGMIAESKYIGRMARIALGLWRGKDGDLRCSVMKWTDGKKTDDFGNLLTVGLEMEKGGAVVARHAGNRIDLHAEREARKERKKGWKTAAAKPPEPEQRSLLDRD